MHCFLKINIVLFLILLLQSSLDAQMKFEKVSGPTVIGEDMTPLLFPWAGGLNNPQFSAGDLNNDGIDDLFIFDRAEDRVLTFLNGGTAGKVDYSYAPELEVHFPPLEDWVLLLDHNCDGAPDLFHAEESGVAITEGYFEGDVLKFEEESSLLFDESANLIGIAETDIPAIGEFTGDDKIDILTFNLSGGYILLYENVSEDCGGLSFSITDECWGDMFETGITQAIDLFVDCEMGNPTPQGGDLRIHPGSTICATDLTGDGHLELILGDVSFDNLVQLTNGGTEGEVIMTAQDTVFPSYNESAIIAKFPAAFALDVNNDNKKDIIVSPNNGVASEKTSCSWFYENIGEDEVILNLDTKRFLNDQMIETGQVAHPRFIDYNNDGLLDLVVANYGSTNFSDSEISSLWLYENTGTAEEPVFIFVTNDFGKLQTVFFTGLVPTMGDLNNDGELDLMVGTSGEVMSIPGDQNGILIFLEAVENSGNSGTFSAPQYVWQTLDFVQESSPQLFDVNNDGKLDLISGNRNGVIYYLENTGSLEEPEMTLVSDFWGEVDVRNNLEGDSQPWLFRNADDELRLAVGSANGQVFLYGDIESNLESGAFELLDTMILKRTAGRNSSVSIADINNDGKLDMVVGNYRGGVEFFSESEDMINAVPFAEASAKAIEVFYPNPNSTGKWRMNEFLNSKELASINIYSQQGQFVPFQVSEETLELKVKKTGVYFISFLKDNQVAYQRLVLTK